MRRLIAAELQKVFTTRLWMWMLIVSSAITALYVVTSIVFADNPADPAPPLSSAEGQRTLFSVGSSPAAAMLAVLATIGVAGEFRHRTATATFLATPDRKRILVAKIAAYGVVGVVYAVVCIVLTAAIALPWLASKDIDVSLLGNGIPAALLGAVIAVTLFAAVGVGLGSLLREPVAATVGLLIYLFLLEPIFARIPAVETWAPYFPGTAARSLAQVHQSDVDFLQPWQGALVLAGYGVVIAAAGTLALNRRDI